MAKLASFSSPVKQANPKAKELSSGAKKPWELVPEGDYVARLKSFEVKDTKDGTGQYINAKFEVDMTEKRKLLIFQKFHIVNKNPKTVQIDMKRLGFLARATGLGELTDTEQLTEAIDVDFLASVGIQPGNNGYPDQNSLKRFGRI